MNTKDKNIELDLNELSNLILFKIFEKTSHNIPCLKKDIYGPIKKMYKQEGIKSASKISEMLDYLVTNDVVGISNYSGYKKKKLENGEIAYDLHIFPCFYIKRKDVLMQVRKMYKQAIYQKLNILNPTEKRILKDIYVAETIYNQPMRIEPFTNNNIYEEIKLNASLKHLVRLDLINTKTHKQQNEQDYEYVRLKLTTSGEKIMNLIIAEQNKLKQEQEHIENGLKLPEAKIQQK